MKLRPLFVFALSGALGFACGGEKPATTGGVEGAPSASAAPSAVESAKPVESAAPAASSASAAPAVSAAPTEKAWKDKTHDEKLAQMKTVVMPKMKEIFQAFDPKDFKDFTCKTCHGPGAKKGDFAMPNKSLPKLSFKDNLAKHMKEHPKAVKFMQEQVVPEMAKALGVKPFDPTTKEGFGCGNCHVIAN